MSVNILDRRREYATLMSLGLPDRLLIQSIYVELAIEIVLALGLSIPLSIGLAVFFNHQLSASWPSIATYLRVQDFIEIMIPAVIILPLAAVPTGQATGGDSI